METMETMETMDAVEVLEDVEVEESCYTLMEVNVDTPKKRKAKAQEETVIKPKKPRSAYLLYYFDVHQIMQKDCPNLPQSEINKCISERWKRLNVAEKAYYLEKAKLEKMGMCTSSLASSQHVPGFRKIFPRANYVLQAEGTQPEAMCSPEDRGQPQESQYSTLALGSEVEQCIAVEGLAEAMATMSHPASSTASATIMVPTVSQSSDGVTADGLLLKGSESRVVGGSYGVVAMASEAGSGGRPMVQRMQGETTQVVIIPTQNLLEFKSLSGDVGPVMMASVGSSTAVEQSITSSYKMDVRTYTRRGRGRCLAPGCSFVYVTRHKPLTCPECGNHLGGKWVPGAKKAQAASKQPDETPSSDSCCQSTKERNVAASKATNNISVDRKEMRSPQAKKQRVVAAGIPTEGSRTKTLKPPAKGAVSNVPKKPVRPILPACGCTGRAVFIVPIDNNRSNPGGLKPNTLKQLGQTTTAKQNSHILDGNIASLLDKRVNILPVIPFKQNTISSFDLGLSTARGRGRCKNPLCDYVYKNRHKPAKCPNCGWELSGKNAKSVDPYKAISLAQKELQRQSTVQLLRRVLQIPETETELQETLTLIQELNSPQVVLTQSGDQDQGEVVETETLIQSSWPRFYESAATQCGLCHYPLFKGGQSTVAGQEDCWLLTETLIQTASLQLKVCPNTQCLALHSFTDLHPGLFNIGNRLLVSVDLLLKIRAQIKLGHHPSQAVRTLLDHVPNHPVHVLSTEESSRINELLLSGYWAFECLTVRDYNDMICGLCGIAPKLEIARRYTQDALELRNVEFTWPEYSASDEVHVDDFWLTMESEAIEQAAFPSDIPITRVDASIIAPFIPPLMRSPTVINTEKDKVTSHTQEEPSGDPSMLVRLIHEGHLRPEKIEEHSEMELRTMLNSCGLTTAPDCTKIELLNTLISLYARVQNGLSTAPQPPQNLTAGKLSKFCPHKVLCGSKYMVRGETARDHVDLLMSSRYWPPVYVADAARKVALCTDMQYPEVATQMWGRNQGCFSDPLEQPEFVSCAELQDQPYGGHLSSLEENQNQQLHPVTKSSSRWLVHPAGPPEAQEPPPALEHHSMGLCKELEPYTGLVADLEKEEEERSEGTCSFTNAQQRPLTFNNPAYYYLYNRLFDFLGSRDIVSQQISQVLKACQPGEVVIRDALYRLGVAQINTEEEEDEGSGVEGEGQEGVRCRETVYEVVLP